MAAGIARITRLRARGLARGLACRLRAAPMQVELGQARGLALRLARRLRTLRLATVVMTQSVEQVARRGRLCECNRKPQGDGRYDQSLHLLVPFLFLTPLTSAARQPIVAGTPVCGHDKSAALQGFCKFLKQRASSWLRPETFVGEFHMGRVEPRWCVRKASNTGTTGPASGRLRSSILAYRKPAIEAAIFDWIRCGGLRIRAWRPRRDLSHRTRRSDRRAHGR